MAKNAVISALAALALLCVSCGRGEGNQAPELLRAIPSDALEIICFDRVDDGLEFSLDSNNVLRTLDFGRFASSRMVVAMDNVGSVEQLLAIDAGHASPDTSDAARKLLSRAESAGIHSAFICGSDSTIKRNILLLSTSETVVNVALRHVDANTSILDSPNFGQVLSKMASTRNSVTVRNSGSRKLLTANVFDDYIPHAELVKFVHGFSEWLVADADDCRSGDFSVSAICDGSAKYFSNLLAGLAPSASRLMDVMPAGAVFAIDMPVPERESFRESFEAWKDAGSSLDSYRKKLKNLKSSYGKDPLRWEKELGIREVARVCLEDGSSLTLVRTSRSSKGMSEMVPNPYPGYVAALYGSAFASAADSCMLTVRDWTVTGNETAVRTFSETGFKPVEEWPGKCTFNIWSPSLTIGGRKEGITLTVK